VFGPGGHQKMGSFKNRKKATEQNRFSGATSLDPTIRFRNGIATLKVGRGVKGNMKECQKTGTPRAKITPIPGKASSMRTKLETGEGNAESDKNGRHPKRSSEG